MPFGSCHAFGPGLTRDNYRRKEMTLKAMDWFTFFEKGTSPPESGTGMQALCKLQSWKISLHHVTQWSSSASLDVCMTTRLEFAHQYGLDTDGESYRACSLLRLKMQMPYTAWTRWLKTISAEASIPSTWVNLQLSRLCGLLFGVIKTSPYLQKP